MAEYINREGTIEVLNHLKPFCHGAAQERMLRRIIREVGFITAADVVEVVRCKDCKFTKRALAIEGYFTCGLLKQAVTENDFCSYGERRADHADHHD